MKASLIFIFVVIQLIVIDPAFAYDGDKCKKVITSSFIGGLLLSSVQFTSSWGDCAAFGMVEKKKKFIAENLDRLKIDSANGKGEYLDALAYLSGCPESSLKPFSAALQANYPGVFEGIQTPKGISIRMDRVIQNDLSLAQSCHIVGL